MPPVTFEDVIAYGAVLLLAGLVACLVGCSRLPPELKLLIYVALGLRFLGSWLRHTILFEFYAGSGDARRYYARGVEYADRFWQLDFSPFVDPGLWVQGKWWGTQFVSFPSGIVLSVIGPSLRAEFVVFSLMAFLGLVGFAIAFRRTYPAVPVARYARWIWLFPSLWYWPSSVGKDAIVLMGLGLATAGFVGRSGRIDWPLITVGVFFVFAIRPQVAAVVLLAFTLGYWLSLGGRWTMAKTLQGLVILGIGLGGIHLSMTHIGVDGFDVEGVQEYMERQSGSGARGGSGIAEVGIRLGSAPNALVNTLFRPFPWEASNPMMLLSALEIWAFWAIVWYRRKNFVHALRNWRSDRLLRVAVPFIVVYSVTLGMLIANLGIIARQRIFLFPFLFLFLEALPARARQGELAPHPAAGRAGREAGPELVAGRVA